MTGPSEIAAGTSQAVLLWAELVVLWSAANYLVTADPIRDLADSAAPLQHRSLWIVQVIVRSFAAAIVTAILIVGRVSLLPAMLMLVLCLLLPALRARIPPSLLAEVELLINVLFVGLTWLIVFRGHIFVRWTLAGSANRFAAGFLIVALFLFVLRGGTYVVRGILNKCGTLPPLGGRPTAQSSPESVDRKEINRGRLIGNLERILLAVIVAAGDYSALGFLVAAKGLIRSRDLEDRDWAEYFLVGTLTSLLVALGVGLSVRLVLKLLW